MSLTVKLSQCLCSLRSISWKALCLSPGELFLEEMVRLRLECFVCVSGAHSSVHRRDNGFCSSSRSQPVFSMPCLIKPGARGVPRKVWSGSQPEAGPHSTPLDLFASHLILAGKASAPLSNKIRTGYVEGAGRDFAWSDENVSMFPAVRDLQELCPPPSPTSQLRQGLLYSHIEHYKNAVPEGMRHLNCQRQALSP